MHTASDIVKSIRATDATGKPVLSESEAELMVNLFASVQVALEGMKASSSRGRIVPFPEKYST